MGKIFIKLMGFVKWKATTKAKVNVEHFEEVRQEFLSEIKNVDTMHEIPLEMVINFDQTGINYIPVSLCTMEVEGGRGGR